MRLTKWSSIKVGQNLILVIKVIFNIHNREKPSIRNNFGKIK